MLIEGHKINEKKNVEKNAKLKVDSHTLTKSQRKGIGYLHMCNNPIYYYYRS
jgi:hypothetical protein